MVHTHLWLTSWIPGWLRLRVLLLYHSFLIVVKAVTGCCPGSFRLPSGSICPTPTTIVVCKIIGAPVCSRLHTHTVVHWGRSSRNSNGTVRAALGILLFQVQVDAVYPILVLHVVDQRLAEDFAHVRKVCRVEV
jgi:hypothetical protein